MFSVWFDAEKRLLCWKLSGFWTPEIVMQFAAAVVAETRKIPPSVAFDSLSDASEFPVQSTEVSEAFKKIMDAAKAYQSGRTAIVISSTLNKLQAERSVGRDNMRTFRTMDEALAWLRPVA